MRVVPNLIGEHQRTVLRVAHTPVREARPFRCNQPPSPLPHEATAAPSPVTVDPQRSRPRFGWHHLGERCGRWIGDGQVVGTRLACWLRRRQRRRTSNTCQEACTRETQKLEGHESRSQYKAGSAPGWRKVCTLAGVFGARPLAASARAADGLPIFFIICLFLLLFGSACTNVPAGRSAVQSVAISGNSAIDADELREKLATVDSPAFLGLFQGVVYDYNVFDRFVLERDLQRIERYYRARGYYQTRARAGRVFFVAPNKVRVDIQIEEGPKMLVGRVDVHGLEALKEPWVEDITLKVKRQLCGRNLCQQPLRKAFEEEPFQKASEALEHALEDHGYAYASVQRAADVDLPKNRVSVGFFARLGPKTTFGEVTIVGLGKIPEAPVRRALDLHPGTPYSREELDLAERALLDLNVFSSVVISPDLAKDGALQAAPVVPIKVTVEPDKLKAIHVGGGVQVDSIQSDIHLVGGWEHRNFFGGLRSLTFELKPGVVLYPTRFPTFKAPQKPLPELKFNAQFRQPGFLEARTGLFTRLDGSISPVILTKDEVSNLLGYRDIRISGGLDRSFNSLRLYGSISHTVQFDSPFLYFGDPQSIDLLHSIIISYPELVLTFDLRDQQVHPHEGIYVTTDLQTAGLGGSAVDLKTQDEIRGYLPISRKWTLAARVRIGLLFPQNYGDTIEATANGNAPPPDKHSVRDTQLMFLRGFFAGGLGSNRGYALREIGPHGVVQQGASTLAKCVADGKSSSSCDLPLGGFTLWEASVELRYPIAGALTGALFTDTADVSDRKVDFRLNRPHLSVGLGIRYDTPVGPIRLDAGYRVPGLQAPAGSIDEGTTSPTFTLPMAVSFGIGEAF